VPEIKVTVIPQMLNFTETPVVELTVHYQDRDNDIDFSDTLVFTENTEQTFRIAVLDESPRTYQVTVTYHLADGSIAQRDPVELDKPRIIIPRYIPVIA
jgi:hypothetical protein